MQQVRWLIQTESSPIQTVPKVLQMQLGVYTLVLRTPGDKLYLGQER